MIINIINKSLIIAKVFLKKFFKFSFHYEFFDFKIIFMLILLLNNYFIEKQSGKKNTIKLISIGNLKIIFILLAKLITIQI